jgi:hypothetical protein
MPFKILQAVVGYSYGGADKSFPVNHHKGDSKKLNN